MRRKVPISDQFMFSRFLAIEYQIKIFTVLVLLMSVPGPVGASGNFVTIALPKGVVIDIPRNWAILSNNQRITLDTHVESRIDLRGLEKEVSSLLFAANYYDDLGTVNGILNLRYYPELELSQSDVRSASASDIEELNEVLKAVLSKEMGPLGMPVVAWMGTKKKLINGITVFVTEYSRKSLKVSGNFRVRLIRVFAGSRSFTLTVSYLESKSFMMRTITDRIISSLKLTGVDLG